MRHQMKLQQTPFEQIKSGSKTIEVRLNDEKRQLVRVGDEIEFSLIGDSSQKILTQVKGLHHFKTFKELFEAFRPEEYGAESVMDYSKMYNYYSQEEEEKYGVMGIEVESVPDFSL